VFGDARLSKHAKAFIDNAAASTRKIAVSVISLAEIVYLVEKKRVPPSAYEDLANALSDPDHVFTEEPLSAGIVGAMRLVPRDAVPDMPDRIVAATAIFLLVPVISRDGRIRASSVETIW
jgi:PIN domain nuclease of toxin-antitoxin system